MKPNEMYDEAEKYYSWQNSLETLKLSGRPDRDTCISADDILNLKIALAVSTDSNDIL